MQTEKARETRFPPSQKSFAVKVSIFDWNEKFGKLRKKEVTGSTLAVAEGLLCSLELSGGSAKNHIQYVIWIS